MALHLSRWCKNEVRNNIAENLLYWTKNSTWHSVLLSCTIVCLYLRMGNASCGAWHGARCSTSWAGSFSTRPAPIGPRVPLPLLPPSATWGQFLLWVQFRNSYTSYRLSPADLEIWTDPELIVWISMRLMAHTEEFVFQYLVISCGHMHLGVPPWAVSSESSTDCVQYRLCCHLNFGDFTCLISSSQACLTSLTCPQALILFPNTTLSFSFSGAWWSACTVWNRWELWTRWANNFFMPVFTCPWSILNPSLSNISWISFTRSVFMDVVNTESETAVVNVTYGTREQARQWVHFLVSYLLFLWTFIMLALRWLNGSLFSNVLKVIITFKM